MKRADVRIIVLTSGEHIIGQVTNEDERGYVTVETPVSIMPNPNPQMRGQLIFIPYLQFSDLDSCVFPPHNVRHVIDGVKEDLVNAYARQFGDGIEVPSQQVILS